MTEKSEHYHINNKILKQDEEKEETLQVNVHELLLGKTAIQACNDGTADKIAFNFNDSDEVTRKITQLFRMINRDDQPQDIHIAWIRKELLVDPRLELSIKNCWVIINLAFPEVAGGNKKYINPVGVLNKIKWMKNDFVQNFGKEQKLKQAASDRKKEWDDEAEQRKIDCDNMLLWIEEHLENYKSILSAAEANDIRKLIKENKIPSAKGQLEYYLFDVHKVKEEAA